MTRHALRGGRAWLTLAGVTAALGAVAFACGSDDPGGGAACEGAACDAGGGADGIASPDGTTPGDGASSDAPVGDGGLPNDAGDAGDAEPACPGPAGTLDPTFGDGGIVVLSFPGETATADAVAIRPDGKIVVAGTKTNDGQGFALVRLMPNGSVDATFGVNGLVETKVGNTNHVVSAVALQPDGKVLVSGWTRFVGQNFDFALLRYLPDGALDPTFGSAGVVLTDFDTRTDQAMAMALLPDGRILLSGQTLDDDRIVADMAFARYNADGSLDATFGTGGRAVVDIRGTGDQARSIVLLGDGRIVAAGVSVDPATNRVAMAVVRLTPTGTLDPTFGDGGAFVVPSGSPNTQALQSLVVDRAGRPVAVGHWPSRGRDFALLRLSPNGAPDPTFGDAGLLTTDFGGRTDEANRLRLTDEGQLVVAGETRTNVASEDQLAVARYLEDGGLDPSFGDGGTARTPLPSRFEGVSARDAVLDTCGFVVVGGWFSQTTNVSTMGIVRYR